MSEFAVARVGQLDLVELDLISREMHDARRNRHPTLHADAGQEAGQESRAAGHMVKSELGAVAMLTVAELADVARIVKQRCDQRHDGALGTDAHAALDG